MTQGTTKRQVAETIWLHYFNQELFKRGIISERDRNRMSLRVENRKSSATRRSGSKAVSE